MREATPAVLVFVVFGVVLVLFGGIAAADGEPPMADAGLDQNVSQGTTVYLDGGGSYDPDGGSLDYEWEITTPSGDATMPLDPNAETTSFEASQLGEYTVTLTVTDDAGRTSSDTLYVRVHEGDPPDVTLAASDETVVIGETVTFEADVGRGDAPIDGLRWYVDGDRVRTVSDPGSGASLERTVDRLGERDVAVVVEDAAGVTVSDSVAVAAEEPTEEAASDPPGGWYGGDAGDAEPVIDGPQTVTGEDLDATYSIDTSGGPAVADVVWRVDGSDVATGPTFEPTWDPGTHLLSAKVEFADGSNRIATFEDDEREVVAKPPVELEFRDIGGYDGVVDGDVVAEDAFGELRTIRVYADGRPVDEWAGTGTSWYEFEFLEDGFEDNTEVELTAVATDHLGQETRTTETVEVTGQPEVVSSEINDTDVDSYHERIDSDRYMMEYEVVVDLNGNDPEDVELEYRKDQKIILFEENIQTSQDRVTHNYKFASKTPGEYVVSHNLSHNNERHGLAISSDSQWYKIQPTDPEPRIRSHVQQEKDPSERRILVDASDSFDPDNTQLEYTWDVENVEFAPGRFLADVNVHQSTDLSVRDDHRRVVYIDDPLYEYYSPETEVVHADKGSSLQSQIRYKFETEAHDISEEGFASAEIEFELINAHGDVDWELDVATGPTGKARWQGNATISGQEFVDGGQPYLRLYNAENPYQTERFYSLPEPDWNAGEEFRHDLTIDQIQYVTEQPVYKERMVDSERALQTAQEQGFEIHEHRVESEYIIEEYYHQEAEYSHETKEFDTEVQRQFFLDGASGWGNAGTESTTEYTTEVDYEWRSSRGGSGSFTGSTRERTTRSAQYRTEYQFRSQFGGTYWSSNQMFRGDTRTGNTQTVQTRSEQTTTDYRYRIENTVRETETTYLAEKRMQIQPEISEWRHYDTVDSSAQADILDERDSLRIGSVETAEEWHLRKQVDTDYEIANDVDDESDVIETRAVVTGDIAVLSDGDSDDVDIIDEFRDEFRSDGFVSEEKIRKQPYDGEPDGEICDEYDPDCGLEQ